MAQRDKFAKELEDSPFKEQLSDLVLITKRLRNGGLYILMGLITSIIIFATCAFILKSIFINDGFEYFQLIVFSWAYAVFALLCGVLLLYRFNSNRNKGMIIYDEITEEIDWSSKRKEFLHRPPIEVRIIIKEFLKSSDLPFTSGKNGQFYYLILYIIVCISIVIPLTIIR